MCKFRIMLETPRVRDVISGAYLGPLRIRCLPKSESRGRSVHLSPTRGTVHYLPQVFRVWGFNWGAHLGPLGIEQLAAVLQAKHLLQLARLGALAEGLHYGAAHLLAALRCFRRVLQRPGVGIVLLRRGTGAGHEYKPRITSILRLSQACVLGAVAEGLHKRAAHLLAALRCLNGILQRPCVRVLFLHRTEALITLGTRGQIVCLGLPHNRCRPPMWISPLFLSQSAVSVTFYSAPVFA